MEHSTPPADGKLPAFVPGQSYLDHAEEMLLELFQDVRSLIRDKDLNGTQRVAAAEVALYACEQMRDLKYPPKPDDDRLAEERPSESCGDTDEEDEDDEDTGWWRWRPWRRGR